MKTIDTLSVYKGVAVVAGPRVSFLDHVMPLVHKWNIPLVCTETWVYTCAQLFYPSAEVILASHGDFQKILSNFKTFITVEPCRLHHRGLQFGEFVYKGKGETIASFHGNPYKFRNEYWIERYLHEDALLIYGKHLIDYLEEKGVYQKLKKVIYMGNLRKEYYDRNRPFFDRVSKPHIFPDKKRKTIFWGPSWSYPQPPQIEEILDYIPEEYQIMVKFHPFTYRLFPEQISFWKDRYRHHDQILLIDEIPLIYPLIQQADYYLGDYSSVAYDYLSLNRPLFLLGGKKTEWAMTVKTPQELFAALKQGDTLAESRAKTYKYVYSL